MPTSKRSPFTLLLDAERRDAIDAIARSTQRDVADVIDDALDDYLATHRRQAEHIWEGLRQADAGEFASGEEVAAAFARWR